MYHLGRLWVLVCCQSMLSDTLIEPLEGSLLELSGFARIEKIQAKKQPTTYLVPGRERWKPNRQ